MEIPTTNNAIPIIRKISQSLTENYTFFLEFDKYVEFHAIEKEIAIWFNSNYHDTTRVVECEGKCISYKTEEELKAALNKILSEDSEKINTSREYISQEINTGDEYIIQEMDTSDEYIIQEMDTNS